MIKRHLKNINYWSEEEIFKLKKLWYENYSLKDISEVLHRTTEAVRAKAYILSLYSKARKTKTIEKKLFEKKTISIDEDNLTVETYKTRYKICLNCDSLKLKTEFENNSCYCIECIPPAIKIDYNFPLPYDPWADEVCISHLYKEER